MVEGRDDAPGVLIFRKRLLPYSETFIASQGQALKRYRPLFVGLERHEQGLHYLKEGTYSLLQDHASSVGLARLPMHLGMKPNARWLRTLRAHKPQLIHVHFGNGVAAAMPLAKALEIPMLVSWHGHDISKPLESGFRQKVRRAIAMADHHIAVSSYIADRLLEADCPQSKMTVHHMQHIPYLLLDRHQSVILTHLNDPSILYLPDLLLFDDCLKFGTCWINLSTLFGLK